MFNKEYQESPSNYRYSDYLTDFPPHAIIADISIEMVRPVSVSTVHVCEVAISWNGSGSDVCGNVRSAALTQLVSPLEAAGGQPRSRQTPGSQITGLWCGQAGGGWHAAVARTCGAQAACGHSWHVQGMSRWSLPGGCGAARGWGGLRCGGGGSVGPTFGQLGVF